MKRFLVFCFEIYYPKGGPSDLVGSYDELVAAKRMAEKKHRYNDFDADGCHASILDIQTGEVWSWTKEVWDDEKKKHVKGTWTLDIKLSEKFKESA